MTNAFRRRRYRLTSISSLLIGLTILWPFSAVAQEKPNNALQLRHRVVTAATAGADTIAPHMHFFLRLDRPLDGQLARRLRSRGVTLTEFLYGTSYVAVADSRPISLRELASVSWIGEILPTDKLSTGFPAVLASMPPREQKLMSILFHEDVSEDRARSVLMKYGRAARRLGDGSFEVPLTRGDVDALARLDPVKWIGPAPKLFSAMAETRSMIQADAAQQAVIGPISVQYEGLSGKGTTIGIVDTAVDGGHDDFWDHDASGARTTLRITTASTNPGDIHGTHVAGIAAANGWQSGRQNAYGLTNYGSPFDLRGVAPEVRVRAIDRTFGQVFDIYANAHDMFVLHGADVSNHSYTSSACSIYDASSVAREKLVHGLVSYNGQAVPARSAVYSAGNNGGGPSQICAEAGYFSIFNNDKNTISVGAINKWGGLAPYSALGPSRDGRIKPDLVAVGGQSEAFGVRAPASGINAYLTLPGTSMAAPQVTGTVALLTQMHKYASSEPLWPSTVKAAVIQGATDLTDTVTYSIEPVNVDTATAVQFHRGPDYATGYGLLNVKASTDVIGQNRFVEDVVTTVSTVPTFYFVDVPAGAARFRVTMVWDDEAGSVMTSDMSPKLVNDLDLRLEAPDGTFYLPWVLPPLIAAAQPGQRDPITFDLVQPAIRAYDHLNNVEQVEVGNPKPGRWTVRVTASALPMLTGQKYSLAVDHGFPTIRLPEIPRMPGCGGMQWGPYKGGIRVIPGGQRCGLIPIMKVCLLALQCGRCPFGQCGDIRVRIDRDPAIGPSILVDRNGRQVGRLAKDRDGIRISVPADAAADAFLVVRLSPVAADLKSVDLRMSGSGT